MVKKKKKFNNNREKKKREKRSTGDTEKRIYTHTYIQYTHTYTHIFMSCTILIFHFAQKLERSTLNSFSKRFFPFEGGIFLQKWIQRSIEFNAREIDRFQRLFPLPPPHPLIMTTNLFREKFRVPRAMIAYVRQRRAIKP